MPQIKLTALKSGVPIGFMAALGVFRHADTMTELGPVRLRWMTYGGQWCAVLETNNPITPDQLVDLFVRKLKSMRTRPEFAWAKAVKSAAVATFRLEAKKAIEQAISDSRELADWFQSFATDLVHSEEGELEPTPFDMTVARQLFLADAEWLTKNLAEPDKKKGDEINRESFKEALFGPWKYADNQHSLGWDPATILMGAFTPKAPTAMSKAGVRAAIWLAMECLPLFPCFFDGGLATSGFAKQGRKLSFQWAAWESPLSLATVRILLAQVPGIGDKERLGEERLGRGLSAMYTSTIFKPNKYLTSFQAAELKA